VLGSTRDAFSAERDKLTKTQKPAQSQKAAEFCNTIPPKSDILHRATMTSGGMINGLRFIAMRWDDSLPPAEAAKRAGTPAA
jgi:hypothetical protein